jgi:hypothetical protein
MKKFKYHVVFLALTPQSPTSFVISNLKSQTNWINAGQQHFSFLQPTFYYLMPINPPSKPSLNSQFHFQP